MPPAHHRRTSAAWKPRRLPAPRERPGTKRGDTEPPAACARKGIAVPSSVQPTAGAPAGQTYE
jgi:hypothetical protein